MWWFWWACTSPDATRETPVDTSPVDTSDRTDDTASPPRDPGPVAVVINELMASNAGSLVVGDDTPDWVELANLGTVDVDLTGFGLRESADDDPAPLVGLVVPAGGVLLLYADGDPSLGRSHLPFRLSGDGESLALVSPRGRVIDAVIWPVALDDVAWARAPHGGDAWVAVVDGSPGQPNP